MSRFLVRPKACHENFRTVFRPERRHSSHFRTTAYRVQRRTRNETIPCQAKSLSQKLSDGPGAWLIPSKKMPSGRTAMYSPEDIFPLGITHPSRPAAKL